MELWCKSKTWINSCSLLTPALRVQPKFLSKVEGQRLEPPRQGHTFTDSIAHPLVYLMLKDKTPPPIFMCYRDLQNSSLARPFPSILSAETEPAVDRVGRPS